MCKYIRLTQTQKLKSIKLMQSDQQCRGKSTHSRLWRLRFQHKLSRLWFVVRRMVGKEERVWNLVYLSVNSLKAGKVGCVFLALEEGYFIFHHYPGQAVDSHGLPIIQMISTSWREKQRTLARFYVNMWMHTVGKRIYPKIWQYCLSIEQSVGLKLMFSFY